MEVIQWLMQSVGGVLIKSDYRYDYQYRGLPTGRVHESVVVIADCVGAPSGNYYIPQTA